jgi:N-acetylneuraminate synthase
LNFSVNCLFSSYQHMKKYKNGQQLEIDGRLIGPNHPPYVIAEISGNHNGSLVRTLRLLDSAKQAGADAVKLQTYRADTITIDHHSPEFIIQGGLWDGRRLYELYEEAHTPWAWHEEIFAHARAIGLTVFSSPFDPTAVELLERLGAPAYKIASPELVDLPLIQKVAATGKPVIMSTGLATLPEIEEAVATARKAGAKDIVLLQCTSAYPAPPDEANLATIPDLAHRLGVVVGLSDHTPGHATVLGAVALGARMIEKHFTDDVNRVGPDHAFSMDPLTWREMVDRTRELENALGNGVKKVEENESQTVILQRRSIRLASDMREGEVIHEKDLEFLRPCPADGLPPYRVDEVIGKKLRHYKASGEHLRRCDLE